MMVSESKHFKGQIPSTMGINIYLHNRCFEPMFWRVHRKEILSRTLVRERDTSTYQSTTLLLLIVNKMVGGQNHLPMSENMETMVLSNSKQISLRAAHLAGHLISIADHLSRGKIQHTEWSLSSQVLNQIISIREKPMMDLFASR